MYETIKGQIQDDLKANFRGWELGCDNPTSTEKLAKILLMRHPDASFDMAYTSACHWTGYDDNYET